MANLANIEVGAPFTADEILTHLRLAAENEAAALDAMRAFCAQSSPETRTAFLRSVVVCERRAAALGEAYKILFQVAGGERFVHVGKAISEVRV